MIDKWFALQAQTQRPDAIDQVTRLLDHEAFTLKNPNRARALIGAFAGGNPTGFHRADGAGYALVADQLLALDRLNPQVAARMMTPFGRWRRYDAGRQDLMKAQLERILASAHPLARQLRDRQQELAVARLVDERPRRQVVPAEILISGVDRMAREASSSRDRGRSLETRWIRSFLEPSRSTSARPVASKKDANDDGVDALS